MAKDKGASERPVVGVDLGGTKVLAGVVSPTNEILATAKRATKAEAGVDAVVERLVKTVRDAVSAAGLELDKIEAVCSAAPGPLDPEAGVVRNAPNLPGWENVPFAHLVSEGLGGLPVFIENDVNLGTLGEFVLGAGRGYRNIGIHGSAGEIGHTVVLADGPVCGCGNRGCLEAVASRTAIERDIWLGIKAGRESSIREILKRDKRERLTSGVLAEAYSAHDPLVAEVIGRVQFYLGLCVANVINLIDPELVILGGGVVEALDEGFLEPIRRTAYQYTLNKLDARNIDIVPAKLGDDSVLLGAAVNARWRLAER
ncbi:MAG: Glucokinase [Chloroflexi bacterium ADurb.Bin325]|nr:MAG: Glucokinase [Chloroflexi bacterium ADurb.Bin325]